MQDLLAPTPEEPTPSEELILKFLAGACEDSQGRLLADILEQDDAWWEDNHDFIQWLFPLPERSEHHPRAPVLSIRAFERVAESRAAKENLLRALCRYARSLGLQAQPDCSWVLNPDRQLGLWVRVPTHQDLRISRVLRCLTLAGLGREASAFFTAVNTAVCTYRLYGHQPALDYWKHAATSR